MSDAAQRLKDLGVALPSPAAPVANYVPFARTGNLLFISGQLPYGPDGKLASAQIGKLGPETPLDAAQFTARLCAINLLAQAKAALGDLDSITRVVRLGGFFNVASRYDALPAAMNGASDLMAAVFGERGRHARTTVGVAHLPLDAMAEVDALFEVA